MRRVVSEELWKANCAAVGQHPNSIPKALTDVLLDRTLRAKLKERIEFPDRLVEGLYLRCGIDREQTRGGRVENVPGPRKWRLRGRVRGGDRFHFEVGDARKGMTVEQARDRARVEFGKLAAGLNPQALAKADAARMQTVGTYLEETFAPQVLAHYKTGDEMRADIRREWAVVLDKPLASLTRGDIEGALTTWKARPGTRGKKEISGSRLKKVWHRFAHLLRHASEGEVISADLARRLLRKPDALYRAKDGEHVRWLGQLDPDEPRKLRDALAAFETGEPGGGAFLRTCVRLALATGCRAGEILSLSDATVNLRQRTALLRAGQTKGNKDHRITLNDAAVQAITSWLKVRDSLCIGHGGAYFPRLPGKPVDHWSRRLCTENRDWADMRRAAGLDDLRCACCNSWLHFHDLRHSHAVAFLKAGGSMGELQKQLGHSDITITQRHYGHILEEDVRRVVLSMPDVLAV